MNDDIRLIHGDCLDVLPTLEAGSVDAIVTDPPYHRIVSEAWDRQWKDDEEYLLWVDGLCVQWSRVLKPHGSLFVFASPQMAARVECVVARHFRIINAIVWRKDAPCKSLIYGPEKFRGFVEMSERIIFAEHRHGDDLAASEAGHRDGYDKAREEVFGRYLRDEFRRAGATNREIAALFPSRTGGTTGCVSNWLLGLNAPTEDQYHAIREHLNRSGGRYLCAAYEELRATYEELRATYEELRATYEATRRPFVISEKVPFTDVWDFPLPPVRKDRHPCEKPVPLLRHILNTSTRENDLVLDCFAGSGSTLVACMKTGRRAIGIEMDPKYIPVIERRIAAAETPLFS